MDARRLFEGMLQALQDVSHCSRQSHTNIYYDNLNVESTTSKTFTASVMDALINKTNKKLEQDQVSLILRKASHTCI